MTMPSSNRSMRRVRIVLNRVRRDEKANGKIRRA